MKNRPAIYLTILLLAGLPMLAHASEVGHIMDSVFMLIKVGAGLLALLILGVFLLVKAIKAGTRK